MDLRNSNLRKTFFQYLIASFGGALISSIYSIVDLAMVGKYQGAEGTAAIALISPFWNVIYSLGLLVGIGGAVPFSTLRGKSEKSKSNEYFTASVIAGIVLALITWVEMIFFDRQLLMVFGANETLMPLARAYIYPIKFAVPLFIFNQMLSAFVRNDGDPSLATKGVMFGGIFNVFGDYFFVFTMDMGIMGAGLATAIGQFFTFLIIITHFRSKLNTLKWVRPQAILHKWKVIITTGFSTFFVDVAMGILTVFFNRQIMKYLNTNALAIYGIVANIGTFAQCCAYSVGQAAQPINSVNLGAGKGKRVRSVLRYSLVAVAFFGVFWTVLSLSVPNMYVKLLTTPTDELLAIAPGIIRKYGLSFLLQPLNIFSTYYFQALMKRRTSFTVSVSRGAVISGILIYTLPALFGADSIWFAMPITELVVAVYVVINMRRYTRQLPGLA